MLNVQQRTVEYTRFLINRFSRAGTAVLSLYSGTGTDMEAAVSLGRSVFCFDKDPKMVRLKFIFWSFDTCPADKICADHCGSGDVYATFSVDTCPADDL